MNMTMNMFQKKRPDRRAFAIEQGPHTYVGEPLEDQSAYTTQTAVGKNEATPHELLYPFERVAFPQTLHDMLIKHATAARTSYQTT